MTDKMIFEARRDAACAGGIIAMLNERLMVSPNIPPSPSRNQSESDDMHRELDVAEAEVQRQVAQLRSAIGGLKEVAEMDESVFDREDFTETVHGVTDMFEALHSVEQSICERRKYLKSHGVYSTSQIIYLLSFRDSSDDSDDSEEEEHNLVRTKAWLAKYSRKLFDHPDMDFFAKIAAIILPVLHLFTQQTIFIYILLAMNLFSCLSMWDVVRLFTSENNKKH